MTNMFKQYCSRIYSTMKYISTPKLEDKLFFAILYHKKCSPRDLCILTLAPNILHGHKLLYHHKIKEYYKSKSFSGLVEISRKILTKNISHINIILSMSFLKLRRDIKIQMRFYEDSGSIV